MNERTLAVLRKFKLPTALPDINHNSPLHHAALNGKERAVQSLIDVGEDVESTNAIGRTPLHLACSRGQMAAIKMLIRKGQAYIDVQDNDGLRPITLAIIHGFIDVVEYLLSEGTNIDDPNEDGTTPLMEAVLHEQFDIVEILLENGADVDLMDQGGQTALHMAVRKSDMEMINALLNYGADPTAEDFDAVSPLDLADYMDDREMAEILQEGVDESDDPSEMDSVDVLTDRFDHVIIQEPLRTESKQNQSVGFERTEVKSNTHVGIDDKSIEELVTCPITLDIMKDPVMALDGYWYERSAITSWLQSHGTSPLTKQRMSVECLMPVRPLKHFIQGRLNRH